MIIDIDDIWKLKDSPGLVFIDEECENLIIVVNAGELPGNINRKKFYNNLSMPTI